MRDKLTERKIRVGRVGGGRVTDPVVFVKKESNSEGDVSLLGIARQSVIEEGKFYLASAAPEIVDVFAGVTFSTVASIESKLERVLAMPWPDDEGFAKIEKTLDKIRVSVLATRYAFRLSSTHILGISMCFDVLRENGLADSDPKWGERTGIGIGLHPEIVVSEIEFANILGAFEHRLALQLRKSLLSRIGKDLEVTGLIEG